MATLWGVSREAGQNDEMPKLPVFFYFVVRSQESGVRKQPTWNFDHTRKIHKVHLQIMDRRVKFESSNHSIILQLHGSVW